MSNVRDGILKKITKKVVSIEIDEKKEDISIDSNTLLKEITISKDSKILEEKEIDAASFESGDHVSVMLSGEGKAESIRRVVLLEG